jgi:hypothetical protein
MPLQPYSPKRPVFSGTKGCQFAGTMKKAPAPMLPPRRLVGFRPGEPRVDGIGRMGVDQIRDHVAEDPRFCANCHPAGNPSQG